MAASIFEMNLCVEATSLYLLLEALGGHGSVLLKSECLIRWNAGECDFEKAQEELLAFNIVEVKGEGLKIVPPEKWKTN